MIRVHAYRGAVRVNLLGLNSLNGWLSRASRFFDEISAAKLKCKSSSREIGTFIRDRKAYLKGQALPISILHDANNSRALELNIGYGDRHTINFLYTAAGRWSNPAEMSPSILAICIRSTTPDKTYSIPVRLSSFLIGSA